MYQAIDGVIKKPGSAPVFWGMAILATLMAPLSCYPATARDLPMSADNYIYRPYTQGMTLPDGVFPPMQGYTHGDLIAAAQRRVEALMVARQVDPALIREAMIALATHLTRAFEKEGVEYQVASWYQKTYDDPSARSRSVERMGEDFGGAAVDAAADSLEGSALLLEGKHFYGEFIEAAGDGVHDLIVTLNTRGA